MAVSQIEQPNGNYRIEFVPNMQGIHKLTILYGGNDVKGSPFNLPAVSGRSSDARASGNGLVAAHRGKETSFIVYCPTQPNVQIDCNDGHSEKIEPKIKSLGNNEWRVSYVILSVGSYIVRASCPNRGPLPGSPWNIVCVDSTKVQPIGGWGMLLDNEGRLILPARIILDTTHGGPGELMCTVDGREIG